MKHIKLVSSQLPKKATEMEMSKKCQKFGKGCPPMYS